MLLSLDAEKVAHRGASFAQLCPHLQSARRLTAEVNAVQLIESGKAGGLFPSDVIERAQRYLAAMPGGTGAYSDSRGAMVLRKDIAKVRPSSLQP